MTTEWRVPVAVSDWGLFLMRMGDAGIKGLLPIRVAHDAGCPCEKGLHAMTSCTCDVVDVYLDRESVSRTKLEEIFPGLR